MATLVFGGAFSWVLKSSSDYLFFLLDPWCCIFLIRVDWFPRLHLLNIREKKYGKRQKCMCSLLQKLCTVISIFLNGKLYRIRKWTKQKLDSEMMYFLGIKFGWFNQVWFQNYLYLGKEFVHRVRELMEGIIGGNARSALKKFKLYRNLRKSQ